MLMTNHSGPIWYMQMHACGVEPVSKYRRVIAWVPVLVWYVTDTYRAVTLAATNTPYL